MASRPGHTLPVGADPNSEDRFVGWVNSIHPAFEATALGKRLIAEGFDSVHDAHLVTVLVLAEVSLPTLRVTVAPTTMSALQLRLLRTMLRVRNKV